MQEHYSLERRFDLGHEQQVARTSVFEARGSSLAIAFTVSSGSVVSRLRRPFLSNRYFFITVRLLKRARLVRAAPAIMLPFVL